MHKIVINLASEKSVVETELGVPISKLREKTSADKESQKSTKTLNVIPPTLYFKDMKMMPCVKFERYLMLVEDTPIRSLADIKVPEDLTPIPIFLACLVLAIRENFENELKKRVCFLESNSLPTHEEIMEFATAIYNNSESLASALQMAKERSCSLLFCTLLEFLQRFQPILMGFSEETNFFGKMENSVEPCRPDDTIIMDQVIEFIQSNVLQKKASPHPLEKKLDDPCLNKLGVLIESYYFWKGHGKATNNIIKNKFYALLYRDLRLTNSSMQRYILRFILKNCIYIIRRYVCVVSGRLRRLRKESWEITHETIIPKINAFAARRMAGFLACTVMEIRNDTNTLEDRINLLEKIFEVDVEKIWYRQKKISEVLINTQPKYCHKFCICGKG